MQDDGGRLPFITPCRGHTPSPPSRSSAVTVTWQGHGCEHAPPHTVLFRRESPHGAPPAGAARPVPRAESPFPLLGILRKPVVSILTYLVTHSTIHLRQHGLPGSRFTPDVPARDFSKVLVERKIRRHRLLIPQTEPRYCGSAAHYSSRLPSNPCNSQTPMA